MTELPEDKPCRFCEMFKEANPSTPAFLCPACNEIWVRGLGQRNLMIAEERRRKNDRANKGYPIENKT